MNNNCKSELVKYFVVEPSIKTTVTGSTGDFIVGGDLYVCSSGATLFVSAITGCTTGVTINGNIFNNNGNVTFNNQIIVPFISATTINSSVFSGGTFYGTFNGTLTNDAYLTGATLNGTTLELGRNQGLPLISVDLSTLDVSDNYVSGGTYNTFTQALDFTGTNSATTFSVPLFTSGACINDFYVSNIHSCSPLHINPLDEGNIYFGSTSAVTINLTTKNVRIGDGVVQPTHRLVVGDDFGVSTTAFNSLTVGHKGGFPSVKIGRDSDNYVHNLINPDGGSSFGTTINGISYLETLVLVSGDTRVGGPLYVVTTPNNDNSIVQLLGRRSSDGLVEYMDVSYLVNSLSGDTYVNGVSYDGTANKLTVTRNDAVTFDTFFNTFSGITINGDAFISGNVTVLGTATTVNIQSEQVLIADNFITLNSNVTGGTPTENAGIQISRGNLTNSVILWNETLDRWEVGISGNTSQIITENTFSDFDSYVTGATLNGSSLEINRNQGLPLLSVDLSTLDVNDTFVTGATWSSGSNTVTLSRNEGEPDLTFSISEFGSDVTINANLTITGNTTINSNLNVVGNTSITGTTNLVGLTTVDQVNGNIFSGGTFYGTLANDAYVTGATLNGSSLEINRNQGLPLISVDLSTLDVKDTYVSGGTISGISDDSNTGFINLTYVNDEGIPYTLDFQDTYLTGGTYNNTTSNITLTRNDGGKVIVDLSSIDVNDTFVTGVTWDSINTLTTSRNDGININTTIDTFGDLTVTGITTVNQINGNIFSGGTFYGVFAGTLSNDVYVSGITYTPNQITLNRTQGKSDLIVTINEFSGLTVNGNLNVTGTTTVNQINGSIFSGGTFYGTLANDAYVTGATLNGSSLEIGRNQGLPLLSVDLSGLDDNDTYVTGGTVTTSASNNSINGAVTLSYKNDEGGVHTLPFENTFVTGGTYSNLTSNITLTKNDNTQVIVDLSSIDVNDTFVTGTTWNNVDTLTLRRNDGTNIPLTINTFGSLTVNGDLNVTGTTNVNQINGNIFSGGTFYGVFAGTLSNDAYVTGSTLNGTTLELSRNQGLSTLSTDLSLFATTADTANLQNQITNNDTDISALSATTIYSGTFNDSTDTITLNQIGGGTISITGITDNFVTGATFNTTSNDLTLTRSGGLTDIISNINITNVNDLTVNGNLNVTGTTTVNQINGNIFSGGTFYGVFAGTLSNDAYVTGATLNGSSLEITRNQGLPLLSVDLSTLDNNDTYVTGNTFTSASDNTNQSIINLKYNQDIPDGTYTLTSEDTYTTGTTVDNSLATFYRNDGNQYTLDLSAFSADTFVNGVSYDGTANKLTVTRNDSTTFNTFFNTFSGITINGNALITGDVTVLGTATTVNIQSEHVLIADNFITLNSNVTGGTPTEDAGIQISRGNLTNSIILWNETLDRWEVGISGNTSQVVTENNFSDFDSYVTGATLNGSSLEINRNQGLPLISVDLSTLDVNDTFVTGATWSSGINTVTISRNEGESNLTFGISEFGSDVTINANLTVTGNTTVNSNLNIVGNASVTGTTNLIGLTTVNQINGNIFSGGTFYGTLANDAYVTGATLNGSSLEITRNQGLPLLSVDLSGLDDNDTYVSGGTISGISDSSNIGSIDLTYVNDEGIPYALDFQDTYLTGGTYNNSTTNITLTRNDGTQVVVDLSSLDVNDTFVTGSTWNNVDTLTLRRNDGTNIPVTINTFGNLTVNGDLNVTGTTTVNQINGNIFSGGTFYGDGSNLTGIALDGSHTTTWSAAFNSAGVGSLTYLRRQNGTPTNVSPYVVPFDMTITNVTASSDIDQTWDMTIRKTDSTGTTYSTIHTISSGGIRQKIDDGLSINLNKGDRIAMRMESGTSINYPNVDIYVKTKQ